MLKYKRLKSLASPATTAHCCNDLTSGANKPGGRAESISNSFAISQMNLLCSGQTKIEFWCIIRCKKESSWGRSNSRVESISNSLLPLGTQHCNTRPNNTIESDRLQKFHNGVLPVAAAAGAAAVFQRIASNATLLCLQWKLKPAAVVSEKWNMPGQGMLGRPPPTLCRAFFIAIFPRTTFATLQCQVINAAGVACIIYRYAMSALKNASLATTVPLTMKNSLCEPGQSTPHSA